MLVNPHRFVGIHVIDALMAMHCVVVLLLGAAKHILKCFTPKRVMYMTQLSYLCLHDCKFVYVYW